MQSGAVKGNASQINAFAFGSSRKVAAYATTNCQSIGKQTDFLAVALEALAPALSLLTTWLLMVGPCVVDASTPIATAVQRLHGPAQRKNVSAPVLLHLGYARVVALGLSMRRHFISQGVDATG